MAAHPALHPSEDALRALALGKVNDSTAATLLSHLDNCPDCCKIVAALSSDDFLHRLRQAQGASSTPAPPKLLSDVARAPQPSVSQTPIRDLPPELANNPQYEIVRELGRGGMGVVYLARNKLMDRLEVLKVVNKTLLDHPGAVERFLREIRSAAKLSHANIVAAYSAVQHGDLLAFAMEYIEGEDLASLVKAQGPLPVAHACYYVQQAALGLQHAYEEKMIHRDIKPQNLMLTHKGKKHIVKVLDFGLAKATREKQDDTGLTGEGKMLGTPDYIAPEQTLDAAKADIRADIYSLGCTLYYLLSGRPPFSASSLGAILVAHHSQEAKLLNLVRPEVPEELAAVVRKMMAKAPAKRFQTPLEVVQALAPFVKQRATPKPAPELSSGAVEAKSARVEPPPVPVAEAVKKEPETADVWGSLTEDSIASVTPRKSAVVRKPRAATATERTSKKNWLFGGGLAVGVLLLALLGMWASGVLKVKTKDGTIVLENLAADAEVLVDGERVNVQWGEGGKSAQITVVPGRHKIVATKDGIQVIGEEVEIKDGDRRVLTAKLRDNKPILKDEKEPRDETWIKPAAQSEAPQSKGVKTEDKDFAPLIKDNGNFFSADAVTMTNKKIKEITQTYKKKLVIETFPEIPADRKQGFQPDKKQQFFEKWARDLAQDNVVDGVYVLICKAPPYLQIEVDNETLKKTFTNPNRVEMSTILLDKFRKEKYDAGLQEAVDFYGKTLRQNLGQSSATSVADRANGFVAIFNGKDKTGWQTHPSLPDNWRVVPGTKGNILTSSGPTSHLFSQRGDYQDFHLRAEARINDGGNSGLYFRTQFGPDYPKGYEVQINSTHGDPIKTGSLYPAFNPKLTKQQRDKLIVTDVLVKPNEWFTLDVIAQGNHLVIKVNDKTTVDFVDESNAYTRGRFALQHHDRRTEVEFRKIEIKELK
jgi:serine/threonine protein kinase